MSGGGILSRMRLLTSARGERPWFTTILNAMRIVTAALVAMDGVTGTTAAVAVLGNGPSVWASLGVVIASLAAMVVMLVRGVEDSRWHASALLLMLAGLTLGLLTGGATAASPLWWPMRYLTAAIMFVVVAGRTWRRGILILLIFLFHGTMRVGTWIAEGMPWEVEFVRQLAGEFGLAAFSAAVMYVIMETLLRAGRFTDDAHAAAVREAEQVEVADARERAAREAERFVHDEVLHTLRTIAMDRRDVSAPAAVAVSARLDGLLADTSAAAGAATTFRERLENAIAEVPLNVQVSADDAVSVPPDVENALVLATMEALRNVARHAGTPDARVRLRRSALTVEVEVADDGVGFEAVPTGTTWGVASSIHQRMWDVGGDATVRSAPGEGTTVLLSWAAGRRPVSPRFADSAGYGALAELYPVTSLITVPYFAYALWNAAWLSAALDAPWAGWVAALVLTAVTGGITLFSLRRSPRRWFGPLLLTVAWGVTALNGWALPDGVTNPYLFWAGTSAVAVAVPLALYHPPVLVLATGLGTSAIVLGFTVVRAGAELASSAFLATIVQPMIGIASYLAVRLVLDALAWEAYRTGEESARSRAEAQARTDFVAALNARMLRRQEAISTFVHDVAVGALDPADHTVRARADALERTARDRMLPDMAVGLQQVAAGLRDRGHAVTVRLAEGVPPGVQDRGARALGMVGLAAPRGIHADATLTIMPTAQAWRTALTITDPDRRLAARLEEYVGSSWSVRRDDGVVHLQTTVPLLLDSH